MKLEDSSGVICDQSRFYPQSFSVFSVVEVFLVFNEKVSGVKHLCIQ
jgi:hypothetical protein